VYVPDLDSKDEHKKRTRSETQKFDMNLILIHFKDLSLISMDFSCICKS